MNLFYFSVPVDVNDEEKMLNIIKSCIGTKFMRQWYVIYFLIIFNFLSTQFKLCFLMICMIFKLVNFSCS